MNVFYSDQTEYLLKIHAFNYWHLPGKYLKWHIFPLVSWFLGQPSVKIILNVCFVFCYLFIYLFIYFYLLIYFIFFCLKGLCHGRLVHFANIANYASYFAMELNFSQEIRLV